MHPSTIRTRFDEITTIYRIRTKPGRCSQSEPSYSTALIVFRHCVNTSPQKDGPAGHMSFDGSGACTKDVFIVRTVQLDDGSYNYEIVKTYEDVPPEGLLG